MPQAVFIVFWVILLLLLIFIEFATQDLATIWFIIGSICALVCAAFDLSFLLIQVPAFLVISLVLLIATRPLTKKFMKSEIVRTNLDRIVGMTAYVIKEIKDGELGEVKVEGLIWRAFSPTKEEIKVGDQVYINAISGTRLVVSKIRTINQQHDKEED